MGCWTDARTHARADTFLENAFFEISFYERNPKNGVGKNSRASCLARTESISVALPSTRSCEQYMKRGGDAERRSTDGNSHATKMVKDANTTQGAHTGKGKGDRQLAEGDNQTLAGRPRP